jgi:hypothetical protein
LKRNILLLVFILAVFNCSKKTEIKNQNYDATSKDEYLLANSIEDVLFPACDAINFPNENDLSDTTILELIPLLEIPPSLPDTNFLVHSLQNSFDPIYNAKFYHIDLSGDGALDILYESNFGMEEKHIVAWIKEDENYYFAGMMIGDLLKLYRSYKYQTYSIVSVSGFCCAGYAGDIIVYTPEFNQDKIKYTINERFKLFHALSVPDTIMNPIRFKTTNENYRLRSSPFISNDYDTLASGFEVKEVYGNILAEFKAGSKGTAYAKQKGNENRVWWFVVMDRNIETTYNRFYNDNNAHKMGWLSSRYVETIK